MTSRPLHIVDWRTPYVPALLDYLHTLDAPLADIHVVFPHKRPVRYLLEELTSRAAGHALVPPRLHTVQEFVGLLGDQPGCTSTARLLAPLDQAALLLDILREAASQEDGASPLTSLRSDSSSVLFPWCMRLASLYEECLSQTITPQNLHHLGNDVTSHAAMLLASLGDIFAEYIRRMDARDQTTPNRRAAEVATLVTNGLDQMAPRLGGPVVLAGIYALNGTEEKLFRALYDAGLCSVVVHSDPTLEHFATREHRMRAEAWHLQPTPLGTKVDLPAGPRITLHEGFDLHSQLDGLRATLCRSTPGTEETTAVVLPDAAALIPTLHVMDHTDINISMGYPLQRTALWGLVQVLLELAANRDSYGFFWKDVLALSRHPYVRMLSPSGSNSQPLRVVLHELERSVRASGTRITTQDLTINETMRERLQERGEDVREAEALLAELVRVCIYGFSELQTVGELATALLNLCRFLLAHGSTLWQTHLIDAECLHRLAMQTVPTLLASDAAHVPLAPTSLRAIVDEFITGQRVSFEAEPLLGTQVVGILESRLLAFDEVHIIDCTEANFPGEQSADPLLPDGLRHLLELPDSRQRDRVAAYNLYRLLMNARRAHLYYQCGVQPKGLLDAKAEKSRYVEQLIWEMEKERGAPLDTRNDPRLQIISYLVPPATTRQSGIARTPQMAQRMLELLNRPLSPSLLDAYLRCPARFCIERLFGVREVDEVNEEGDPRHVGTAVHATMQQLLEPYVGRTFRPDALDGTHIRDVWMQQLNASPMAPGLTWDARRLLGEVGARRIIRALHSMPASTILALEHECSGLLPVPEHSPDPWQELPALTLRGTVDRMDLRPATDKRSPQLLVMDYKTGSCSSHIPKQDFWTNFPTPPKLPTEMDELEEWQLLASLSSEVRSLQLPIYRWLATLQEPPAGTDPDELVVNGALVELRSGGTEYSLLGAKPEKLQGPVHDATPFVVHWLVEHMRHASHYAALPAEEDGEGARTCTYCPHSGVCGR